MKKTGLIIGIIIILLIIVGAFFLTKKSAVQTPVTQNQTQTQATEKSPASTNNSQTIESSLKDLLTGGKSVACTYSNKLESATINGKVYVANGKMRGDFETTTSDKVAVKGHMVVDAQTSYVWTDMSNQGMKVSLNNLPKPTGTKSNTPDINQKMNYTCENWNADASVFALPSNITFREITIPSVPSIGAAAGDLSSQCGVCNNVPAGPGREACRTQFSCK